MTQETALCEQLPFWEFEQEPIPHVILADGSLSSGVELLPLDIECFDESRINQLTLGLRAFANSLPEGTTAQFVRFHRFDHPNFTKFDHSLRWLADRRDAV